MAGRLKRKIALVTAAGQGIGRAIAEAFLAEGAKVVATDLDPAKLKGLRGAERQKLDVRSTEAVEALAKDIGRSVGPIEVLVNCAGFVHHGSVLDCSEQDWDFSFDLNVKSMHRTIRTFLPAMLKRKKGAIVNSQIDGAAGRRGTTRLRRSPADGSARHAAGSRHAGGVPGVRRIGLHHRAHPSGRRRLRAVKRSGNRSRKSEVRSQDSQSRGGQRCKC